MANISQNVNIEILEKLSDGTYKRKYPKTTTSQVIGYDAQDVYEKVLSIVGIDSFSKAIVGSYVGNNGLERKINLGGHPKLIIISNNKQTEGKMWLSIRGYGMYLGDNILPRMNKTGNNVTLIHILSTGVEVSRSTTNTEGPNDEGITYNYFLIA